MSSQDLFLGNNYLVQCQQLALQALACALAATTSNDDHHDTVATSSASTSNAASVQQLDLLQQLLAASHPQAPANSTSVLQQQLEKQQELQQQQQQQQQQQLAARNLGQNQWNQYEQAIAAALLSGANTSTDTFKTAMMPHPSKLNNPRPQNNKTSSTNNCRFNPMRGNQRSLQPSAASKLKSTCSSSGKATLNSTNTNANNSNNLIDFYSNDPFFPIMRSESNLPVTESPIPIALTNYKTQPPTAPSSTLLAKLGYVTSRPNAHQLATKLDQKMLDLLEAFYAINDNPEQAAIEMIAKRTNVSVDAISEWFDKKRWRANPNAGPRSPPAKKREGGRVVTFSEYQRSLLEAIFDENNYLHPQEYEELSNLIQVPSRNIKIWFKNRRSKQRLSGRINTPGSANNSD